MDNLAESLARIEAKLDRLINGPDREALSPAECMPLTGCKSLRAQFDWFKENQVRPYQRGKYRRVDVTNARDSKALFGKLT